MRKKSLESFVFFFVLLFFAAGCGGGKQGSSEVSDAISNLPSDDYAKVRKSINAIDRNLNDPNILASVEPLIAIAKDIDGTKDAYTRIMAVKVLALIGFNYRDTSEGGDAIDAIVYLLRHSHSGQVRTACAEVLGTNKYSPVKSDLEKALNDSSQIVQTQACLALLRITDWKYSSPKCQAEQFR